MVNKDNIQTLDGYKVINAPDVLNYDFDYIVICADGKMLDSIQQDIEKIGIEKEKVKLCSNYLELIKTSTKRYEIIVNKQCDVLKEILNATDEQVSSYDWMYKKIGEYGIFPFERNNSKITLTQWGG